MNATQTNSMGAPWCAARVAEARAWRDSHSQSAHAPGWQHVHELLSQLDAPPAAGPIGVERLARVLEIRDMVRDTSECSPGNPTLARAFDDLFEDRRFLMLRTATLEMQLAVANLRAEANEHWRETAYKLAGKPAAEKVYGKVQCQKCGRIMQAPAAHNCVSGFTKKRHFAPVAP